MTGRSSLFPSAAAVVAACMLALPAPPVVAQSARAGAASLRLKAMNVPFEPERLVQFAGQGDNAVVEAFLEAGMPPDSTEPQRGSTALIHAAANGHARIVTRLLDAGAAPNRPDDDGTTPLAAACYFGKAAVVEVLLARGADARAEAKQGASVLEGAIWGGDARIVKRLLAAEADAVGDRRQTPPLVWAAYAGRVEVLSALLEAKPSPSVVRQALQAARRARHANVEALLAKALVP